MNKNIRNDSKILLTEWDKQLMAYHEVGHAVCSYNLPEREELLCITIDPSNQAFGMIKTAERKHHNETEISSTSLIITLLAGRISEEMFLKSKSTSCIYDLEAAQKIATDMVLKFGMGKKTRLFAVNLEYNYLFSESLKKMICEDITEIIINAENEARKILQQNDNVVKEMVKKILKLGTLNKQEIKAFFKEFSNE